MSDYNRPINRPWCSFCIDLGLDICDQLTGGAHSTILRWPDPLKSGFIKCQICFKVSMMVICIPIGWGLHCMVLQITTLQFLSKSCSALTLPAMTMTITTADDDAHTCLYASFVTHIFACPDLPPMSSGSIVKLRISLPTPFTASSCTLWFLPSNGSRHPHGAHRAIASPSPRSHWPAR